MIVAACGNSPPAPVANVSHSRPPPPTVTSPGLLSASHEKVGCLACHTDDRGAVANVKCFACHDMLGRRATNGRGFHASAIVRGKPCEHCHREHQGKTFDLSGWAALRGGRRSFDHALAGWPLTGGHVTACSRCHTRTTPLGRPTFLGMDRRCASCHTQPHGKPSACERCHSDVAWKPVLPTLRFDHNNKADAAFALDRNHAGVECAKCHPGGLFDLPQPTFTCTTCHPAGPPKRRAQF